MLDLESMLYTCPIVSDCNIVTYFAKSGLFSLSQLRGSFFMFVER